MGTQLGNIGLIHKDKGDLDEALRYRNEALKIDKEIGIHGKIERAAQNIKQVKKAIKSKAKEVIS